MINGSVSDEGLFMKVVLIEFMPMCVILTGSVGRRATVHIKAKQGVAVSADDPQTNCCLPAESVPTVNLGLLDSFLVISLFDSSETTTLI